MYLLLYLGNYIKKKLMQAKWSFLAKYWKWEAFETWYHRKALGIKCMDKATNERTDLGNYEWKEKFVENYKEKTSSGWALVRQSWLLILVTEGARIKTDGDQSDLLWRWDVVCTQRWRDWPRIEGTGGSTDDKTKRYRRMLIYHILCYVLVYFYSIM